ncbi:hypothetical protein ACFCXF_14590 [Streptomyces virginiae]|uniref:hypothetical protein n=1 Tax=Streptomyces virginiae TaxID=1961 RepID=UPI0035DA966C
MPRRCRIARLLAVLALATAIPTAAAVPAGAVDYPPLYRCPTGFACIYNGSNLNTATILGKFRDVTAYPQWFSRAIYPVGFVNARADKGVKLIIKPRPPYSGTTTYFCVQPRKTIVTPHYQALGIHIENRGC